MLQVLPLNMVEHIKRVGPGKIFLTDVQEMPPFAVRHFLSSKKLQAKGQFYWDRKSNIFNSNMSLKSQCE